MYSQLHSMYFNQQEGRQAGGWLSPLDKGDKPLCTYHVDHVGPLEGTAKKYKYLLVIIDAFSKFTWIYPTKTVNSEEVIEKLEEQSILFGNPAVIISDRGGAFTSQLFEEYCARESINHHLITTGIPRGNGQVERINRVILSVLTKLSVEKPALWYRHVRRVQQAINGGHQRAIGRTPFEVMFGTKLRRIEDPPLQQLLQQELLESFMNERDELRADARVQIDKIQAENKHQYNLRRKEARNYAIDTLVAIRRTQFTQGSKLLPKFIGPYRVKKKMGYNRYAVEKVGQQLGPKTTTTSADSMKPWSDAEVIDDEMWTEPETDSCQERPNVESGDGAEKKRR